jgi:CRISPR/Cas system CSM-associated protein Csm3 (group 7 of RAMP superfamily)
MVKLKTTLTFSLNSLYHSTGDRLAFGVDKAIYLDPRDNNPAIQATSLKGIIRNEVENILRAKGLPACNPNPPNQVCGDKNLACMACKYFGSPRIKSPLIFQDIALPNSARDSRTGVGIERRRKTAKEDHLFSYEVASGNEFSTEIYGIFERKENAITACALLFLGAKSAFALGGGKSRGLGWIKLKEFKAFLDGEEIPNVEIEKEVRRIFKE